MMTRTRRRLSCILCCAALLGGCAGASVLPPPPPRADVAAVTVPAEDAAPRGAALLERLRTYTGLDERQQARLAHVERLFAVGRDADARRMGEQLDDELRHVYHAYEVRPGDTLRRIAARADVYANPRLWPLLWQANRDRLDTPDRLMAGGVLRVPGHPTVGEIVEALAAGG